MRRSLVLSVSSTVLLASVGAAAGASLFPLRTWPGGTRVVGDVDGDGRLDLVAVSTTELEWHRGVGDGSFEAPISVALPDTVTSVVGGDLNGDGRVDVAAASGASTLLFVALGTPSGFGPVAAVSTPPHQLSNLVLADLNGDAIPDLFGSFVGSLDHVVYVGDGLGGFGLLSTVTSGFGPTGAGRAGDVDGDGDVDVVLDHVATTTYSVFENQGGGTFQRQDLVSGLPGGPATVAAVADFTGDGRWDLVQATDSGRRFTLLVSGSTPGALSFTPLATVDWSPSVAANTAVGDLDLDGRDDLVVQFTSPQNPRLGILRSAATASGFQVPDVFDFVQAGAPALGDFDGDGRLDAVAPVGVGRVVFAPDLDAHDYGLDVVEPAAGLVSALAMADFDADGDLDVVGGGGTSGASLVLRRGDGAGAFAAPETIGVFPGQVVRVRAFDHDGNGTPDVVAVADPGTLSVFHNAGTGSFTPAPMSSVYQGNVDFSLEIGDVTGDGRPDVLYGGSGGVLLHANVPLGLAPPVVIPTIDPAVRGIALADVTADGILDLVTAEHFGPTSVGVAAVYAGNGAGGFLATPFVASAGVVPTDVAAADFDLDGDADVAVVSRGDQLVQVLRSSGSALSVVQSIPLTLSTGSVPRLVATDVTGDGWSDLLLFDESAPTIRTFLGRFDGTLDDGGEFAGTATAELAAGDLDRDGRTDLVLAGWTISHLMVRLGNEDSLGVRSFGVGKPGTNGVPVLSALGAPLLGTSGGLRVAHGLFGAPSVLFLGTAPAAIPFDLGTLLVASPIAVVLPPFPASGTLDLALTLPSDPALAGVTVYLQDMFIDPGAAGAIQSAQTNGLEFTLGS